MMLSGLATSAPTRTLEETKAEFDALTLEEKEIAYRDLYGAGNYTFVEDDELIDKGLTTLEECLLDLSDKEKNCYLLALEASPDYVTDRDFRLQFLRCELFDAQVRSSSSQRILYQSELNNLELMFLALFDIHRKQQSGLPTTGPTK
jgi:hypothetical protein